MSTSPLNAINAIESCAVGIAEERGGTVVSLLPPMPDFAEQVAELKALGWIIMTNGDLARAQHFAEQQADHISNIGWTRAADYLRSRGIPVS